MLFRSLAELTADLGPNKEDITDEEDQARHSRLYLRSVITGIEWTSIEDQADPNLEFTEEKMVTLFRQAPKFFAAIQKVALQWSNFRAVHEDDASKN